MSRFAMRQDVPDVIPPMHSARTLVLCFDGTGDQFDNDNSNVVLLFSALKKDDRSKQMVYYQTGIGTYTAPNIATPIAGRISKIADQAVAWYLDAHVTEGYKFLMQNYVAGDKICLFGFSRGAYTARALAGMLHKVGLLPPHNEQQVPFAYKMYTRCDDEGWTQSKAFKKAFSINVSIEFLGVWDTVCSVGLLPHTLPFTTSNYAIRTFRHALALDEHRAKFMPNCWNKPTASEEKLGDQPILDEAKKKHKKQAQEQEHSRHLSRDLKHEDKDAQATDVEEVWFAGCHCDVGGGSVANDTPNSLARIPLRWMIKQCFLTKTGILFHTDVLADLGINPDALWPEVITTPTPSPSGTPYPTINGSNGKSPTSPGLDVPISETPASANGPPPNTASTLTNASTLTTLTTPEIELGDTVSPIYDQLRIAPVWWFLELLPIRHKFQDRNNVWHRYISCNFGRARHIPHQSDGFKVHRSVKIRMEQDPTYRPRAEFQREPEWVD